MAVVLICKLDASGTDDANAVMTMAGYVGMLMPWNEFEVEARSVLDTDGVELLHGKEFYDTKGPFKGWSRDRKTGLIRRLQNVALGRLDLGITFSTTKAEFSKAKREHRVAHSESVFGFCFRAIIDRLLTDELVKRVIDSGADLTFVLESGDANAGDAQRVFNQVKGLSKWHDRVMYSFGFADKKSSVGLQFADFLAVTSRKYVALYSDKDGYAEETAILSILRDRLFLIDDVAVSFQPVPKGGRPA